VRVRLGGQNVNKVATKIDLRVDSRPSRLATPRAPGWRLAQHRRDAEGRLVITSK
jgi:protein subunit release factor B